jgi:hypothetical protein
MKQTFKYILGVILVSGAVTGCDLFLGLEPESQLSPDQYLTTEDNIASYAIDLYNMLPVHGSTSWGTWTRDGHTDNMAYADPSDAYAPGYWKVGQTGGSYSFTEIYRCNYFFDNVLKQFEAGEITGEKKNINHYIGEVYFFRAWAYFMKLMALGDFPIVKTTLDDDLETLVKASVRQPRNEVARFILDDLDKADQLLPSKEATKRGRVNKDVSLALRARVTLLAASKLFNDPDSPTPSIWKGDHSKNEEKWTRAYDACKAVVDRADVDGAYALDDKYSDFWKDLDSPEVIWAKYFVTTEDIDKAQLYYTIEYYSGWTSMQPTQAMMIDYEMNNGKKFFEEGSGFDPKKPFANRDPRFYYSVAHPFSTYGVIEDGSYNEYELQMYLLFKDKSADDFEMPNTMPDYTEKTKDLAHAVTHTGLELRKWYDPSKPITDKQTITPFYPWFRLAEFYLNFAEAAYMCGKEEECRTYINKVRARSDVNMPAVTEGGEALWDRLVNERRIEMAYEFTRYFDVRRWMIADKYENVPIAGMKTMVLEKGTKKDTVYRMARLSKDVNTNTCYYWANSSERETYIAGNSGRDITTKWTYRWLGKDYEIDYGECPLTFSPTQKYFVPANYLMPIPETEIKKAQNTIVQNPGY